LRQRQKRSSYVSDPEARLAARQTLQATTTAPEKYDLREHHKTVFCVSARKVRFTSAPQNSVLRHRQKGTIYVSAVKQCFASAPEKQASRHRRKTVFCVSARKA
jgi:hypothetical protein